MLQNLDAIVAGWIRYQIARDKADFPAVSAAMALTYPDADPDVAWALVTALLDRAPEELLGAVGAGPLEDAVVHFAPQLIERVEERARRDPRLRTALGGVWLTAGALPKALEARVIAASNGAIRPLPGRKQHWHRRP